MSKYGMDKALWHIHRDLMAYEAYKSDAAAFASAYDLTPDEREALISGDIRALFACGAHPFLVYSYAIRMEGSWSFPFMQRYVAKLEGLNLVDIET